MNRCERRVFEEVGQGLSGSAFHLNTKVAVKDVIEASADERSRWPNTRCRMWWTGHFDFVCTSVPDDKVEFVVEYDGTGHTSTNSEERDRAKNALCRDAGIPILRISHDNMLKEFEQSSVAEYIAHLFVAWRKTGDHYNGRMDAKLDFVFDNPFPPRIAVLRRVCDAVHARKPSKGIIEFTTHVGRTDFGTDQVRLEWCGVVYEKPQRDCPITFCGDSLASSVAGVRTLFSRKRVLTFTWSLPVDDETVETVGQWKVPNHRAAWSEIPGAFTPYVMQEVAEYLVLRDIEDWAKGSKREPFTA